MTHEEKLLAAKRFLGERYVFHPSRRIQKTTRLPGNLFKQRVPGKARGVLKQP